MNKSNNSSICCDGACEKHIGIIYKVKVYGHLWGLLIFNYCESAISQDIQRGFIVEYYNQ